MGLRSYSGLESHRPQSNGSCLPYFRKEARGVGTPHRRSLHRVLCPPPDLKHNTPRPQPALQPSHLRLPMPPSVIPGALSPFQPDPLPAGAAAKNSAGNPTRDLHEGGTCGGRRQRRPVLLERRERPRRRLDQHTLTRGLLPGRRIILLGPAAFAWGGLFGFWPALGMPAAGPAALGEPFYGERSLGHGALASGCVSTLGVPARVPSLMSRGPEPSAAGVNKHQRADKRRLIIIVPPPTKEAVHTFSKGRPRLAPMCLPSRSVVSDLQAPPYPLPLSLNDTNCPALWRGLASKGHRDCK